MSRIKLAALALSGIAVLTAIAGTTTATAATPQKGTTNSVHAKAQQAPLVIGHRGASGYRPEHTLASYELAARMGADYIEPDLVTTSDGVVVARHEPEIGGTTDVAERPEFADRKTTKSLDGVSVTGWFAEDFTLAELKTLRAKERIPELRPNNTRFDGRYQVPTLQEIIDLAKRLSKELGREIGIYPETKHPTYFRSMGLPLEPALADALERNGLNRPKAKVFVQSFEVANLKQLSGTLRVPLVQLINSSGAPYDFVAAGDPRTYDDLSTPAGLAEIATYADGVGPAKARIIPRNAQGYLTEPTSFVSDAHAAGLVVHPWTFRAENAFLPADYRSSGDPAAWGDTFAEFEKFLATGIDGVFADQPDIARAAVDDN
ncbi:MAG: glycerophosphodiester phosphodiesterase [Haloechinothrix sp.]